MTTRALWVASISQRESIRIGAVGPQVGLLLLQLNERLRGRGLRDCARCIRVTHSVFHNRVRWRQRAGWICHRGVSGKQKRLAAASAEVFRAPLAGAAGLGHPVFAAKSAERIGFLPYPLQSFFADVFE